MQILWGKNADIFFVKFYFRIFFDILILFNFLDIFVLNFCFVKFI